MQPVSPSSKTPLSPWTNATFTHNKACLPPDLISVCLKGCLWQNEQVWSRQQQTNYSQGFLNFFLFSRHLRETAGMASRFFKRTSAYALEWRRKIKWHIKRGINNRMSRPLPTHTQRLTLSEYNNTMLMCRCTRSHLQSCLKTEPNEMETYRK